MVEVRNRTERGKRLLQKGNLLSIVDIYPRTFFKLSEADCTRRSCKTRGPQSKEAINLRRKILIPADTTSATNQTHRAEQGKTVFLKDFAQWLAVLILPVDSRELTSEPKKHHRTDHCQDQIRQTEPQGALV